MINPTHIRLFYRRVRYFLQQIWWNRSLLFANYPDRPIVKEFPIGKKIRFQYGVNVEATGIVIGYRNVSEIEGLIADKDFILLEIDITSPPPYDKLETYISPGVVL